MKKDFINSPFHTIPTGNEDLSEVNVIIEIPKGSMIKYEYEKDYGVIKVDRYLYQYTPFFYDYGLIPQTWMSGDDDPLDAIVLTNVSSFPGILIAVRPIGVVCIDDSGERDDKVISVPVKDPRWSSVKSYKDVPAHMLEELKFFLEHYSALQPNKVIKVKSFKDGIDTYKKKFK